MPLIAITPGRRSGNRRYSRVITAQLLVAALTCAGLLTGVINGGAAALSFGLLFAWSAAFELWKQPEDFDHAGQQPDSTIAPSIQQSENHLKQIIAMNDQFTSMAAELDGARRQLQEQSQIKSDFLGHISHEIRTPLNAVVGMAELLSRTNLTPEQQELVSLINSSGETLLSVINDILSYSKMEAGEFALDSNEFDLHELIEGTTHLLVKQARLKELTLTTFVSPTLSSSYLGDSARLRQVLINLLGNSIRFASKGEILVSATEDADDKKMIRFSVKDDCAGMTNSVVATLFSPPTQVDMVTARKYGGTGLGLSVSKKLVELMRGKLGVDNDEEKGTTFWFSVPLETAMGGQDATNDAPYAVQKKLMLAGNTSTSVAVVMAYAKSWGVECVYCPTTEEALSSLHEKPDQYQVVILESAGAASFVPEFLSAFCTDSALEAVHVIVLSDQESVATAAKESGAGIQVLRKPFKKAQLRESLRQCQLSLRRTGEIVRPEAQIKSFIASMEFATRKDNTAPSLSSAAKARLLVVEDNPVNRRLVHLQLRTLGFECDIVENGQEAVDALLSHQYDLVFMDCWMPVLDGFAATAKIRENELTKSKHTTIVAMTANAMESDRDECIAAGMDDYISKPVTQSALRDVLEKWVMSKR